MPCFKFLEISIENVNKLFKYLNIYELNIPIQQLSNKKPLITVEILSIFCRVND